MMEMGLRPIAAPTARTALALSMLSRETGANVHLKLESLQPTGSFKVRGALNTVLSLDDAAPPRFEFMPTVPMSKAERLAAVAPVLRPDHEVARGLCEFMPTVPSALSPSAATQA